MKFVTGLVLAALAITAANAGKQKLLRSTESDSTSTRADCPDDCTDTYKPVKDSDGVEYPNKCFMQLSQCKGTTSGSLDDLSDFFGSGSIDEDDLTMDLTELFGSDSGDGSHVKFNIMSLIGSGSDQVDLQEIIDAFEQGDSSFTGNDDFSWSLDNDLGSGSVDEPLVKSGKITKGKTTVEDSESGSDDLSWLDESDSESGSVDEDPILVKGGSKTPATKGKTLSTRDESDDEDPILMKGATKSGKKSSIVEDDSESASDGTDYLQSEQQTSAVGEKAAAKSSNKRFS